MSKSLIITLPNPKLRQPSQKISSIDKQTRKLAENMVEAAKAWEQKRPFESGVAMAAIQLGKPVQLIVVREFTDKKQNNLSYTAYVNPKIIRLEGDIQSEPEGCLSVPDVYALVPRYSKIKIKALDLDGREVRIKAEGFMARILQHEIDHISGKLFIDRVKELKFFKIGKDGELAPVKSNNEKLDNILRHKQ